MTKIRIALFIAFMSIITACSNSNETSNKKEESVSNLESTNKVVLASEVEWTPLNAARGDQSPQAGTLWGNRDSEMATGFLVKFKDGFSSPPHIHNVTYRGVVISGLIHNDDPNAEKMWMPTGSFWTQPAGEPHITAATGEENMAFIEIQRGPYLVHPMKQSFNNGEKPVNLDKSNIVWVDFNGNKTTSNNPKIAYLWGNPEGEEIYGTFIKLPAGFSGNILSDGSTFRAVIIEGQPEYNMPTESDNKILSPGSYFSSTGQSVHEISSKTETILYVRTDGDFKIKN